MRYTIIYKEDKVLRVTPVDQIARSTIETTHPLTHTHTQNQLSLFKRL